MLNTISLASWILFNFHPCAAMQDRQQERGGGARQQCLPCSAISKKHPDARKRKYFPPILVDWQSIHSCEVALGRHLAIEMVD